MATNGKSADLQAIQEAIDTARSLVSRATGIVGPVHEEFLIEAVRKLRKASDALMDYREAARQT